MYEEFFGLTKKPFSIVPDPGYFYLSTGHREALAHLLYGMNNDGGFILLTGDIGTGKTTACRRLLELLPEEIDVAIILNPKLTVEELLAAICDEFGINYPEGNSSVKVFVSRINDFLLKVLARGRRAVLILEEAQNLKPDVLEQLRLLTNLETNEQKLLQMIMIGQPELSDLLLKPQLRQLSQRITARYHLGPLSQEEVAEYVTYRLSVAGLARGQVFPPASLKKLFQLSGGIPRLINVICDRALLGAYVQGKDRVDLKTLTTAGREISGEASLPRRKKRIKQGILAGLILILIAALGGAFYLVRSGSESTKSSPPTNLTLSIKAEPDPPKKDSLEWPGSLSGDNTMKMAYRTLFKTWHIDYNPGGNRTVCDQAQSQGLNCLIGKGSVITLQQMNRPAVLTLFDKKNGQYYATLTSFQGEKASFSLGNQTRTVDIKEITQHWLGDYLLLWRVPPKYKEALKPGGRGPLVDWVEKHLALAQKQTVPSETRPIYNEELVNQVKKIQLANGIMPDGIVGPKTIMILMTTAGNGDPSLIQAKGSQ